MLNGYIMAGHNQILNFKTESFNTLRKYQNFQDYATLALIHPTIFSLGFYKM